MRGRLLQWFWADLAQLDTAATRAAGGYDDVLHTVKVRYPEGPDGPRVVDRRETTKRLRVQVEPATDRQLQAAASGAIVKSNLTLVFHYKDLEREGLIDPATGDAMVRLNDRLDAIYTRGGALVQKWPNPPGLFAVEVRPEGYGIGGRRNLLIVAFNDRAQGLR